jgi:hypothetical protein
MLAFCGSVAPARSADREIKATAPLVRIKPVALDKANGIGPRFRFQSAPPELPPACGNSIRVQVNEPWFVNIVGARTPDEFRRRLSTAPRLSPAQAERAPTHTSYSLSGDGDILGSQCSNLKPGAHARGHCVGMIVGSDFATVFNFNPTVCHYDNVGVARTIKSHLSIGAIRPVVKPAPDCATKVGEFVADIDDLLSKKLRDILSVFDVLDRHFPFRRCTVETVSSALQKSKYFRSVSVNGPKHVFLLSSGPAVHGVDVSFALTDTGDSELPAALWSRRSF